MKPRSLRNNNKAIEGLPLTMIVVMVVLAITIPLIIGSLRAYDRGRVEQGLASEIDSFISMVQLVYTSGPGNSVLIDFNAASGSMARIDSVIFGDGPGGSMASVIRYTIQDRQEVMTLLEAPNVPMMSSGNTSFQISSGSFRIMAECVSGNIDLNGDGISNDTFIRLGLVQ
jgi:hypothetical protein